MKSLKDRIFSRKLAAFLVATGALWLGVIDQTAWEAVALAYLGSQGLVDLAEAGVFTLRKKAEGTALEAAKPKSADEPTAKPAT